PTRDRVEDVAEDAELRLHARRRRLRADAGAEPLRPGPALRAELGFHAGFRIGGVAVLEARIQRADLTRVALRADDAAAAGELRGALAARALLRVIGGDGAAGENGGDERDGEER